MHDRCIKVTEVSKEADGEYLKEETDDWDDRDGTMARVLGAVKAAARPACDHATLARNR